MAVLDTRDYDVQKLNGEILQSDNKKRVFSPYSGEAKHNWNKVYFIKNYHAVTEIVELSQS